MHCPTSWQFFTFLFGAELQDGSLLFRFGDKPSSPAAEDAETLLQPAQQLEQASSSAASSSAPLQAKQQEPEANEVQEQLTAATEVATSSPVSVQAEQQQEPEAEPPQNQSAATSGSAASPTPSFRAEQQEPEAKSVQEQLAVANSNAAPPPVASQATEQKPIATSAQEELTTANGIPAQHSEQEDASVAPASQQVPDEGASDSDSASNLLESITPDMLEHMKASCDSCCHDIAALQHSTTEHCCCYSSNALSSIRSFIKVMQTADQGHVRSP